MDPRVAAVLKLVDEQPDIDVPALAILVHLSTSRLRHLFHAEMSMPLYRYLKKQRLLHAERLLKTTFLSVKEISDISGFGDASHFVRDFRATFTMSPTAYRRAATVANE